MQKHLKNFAKTIGEHLIPVPNVHKMFKKKGGAKV